MRALTTYKELLDSIHKRPGLYWGDPEHPFTSLVAFLNGYALGYAQAGCRDYIPPTDLVPDDFHKFVTERFGRRFPAGGKGWSTFIRVHTNSELDAFELFFQLRQEYDEHR